MSYESPINIIHGETNNKLENEVLTVIHNLGIDVNKEELVRALRYDREQYQKGYEDRDNEIVRCKDCRYYHGENEGCGARSFYPPSGDWFCADGEKK